MIAVAFRDGLREAEICDSRWATITSGCTERSRCAPARRTRGASANRASWEALRAFVSKVDLRAGCLSSLARGRDHSPMSEADKFLFMAHKLRERAEEALSLAETFRDPEAKRIMHEIAERYQRLAQRLEDDAD
jgi:hypothetical protein